MIPSDELERVSAALTQRAQNLKDQVKQMEKK